MGVKELTPAEMKVVGVLLWWPGISNREISRLLGLHINTVRLHIRSALAKTGAKRRLGLWIKLQNLNFQKNNTPSSPRIVGEMPSCGTKTEKGKLCEIISLDYARNTRSRV